MANNVQIKFDIDNKSLEIAGQDVMKVTQQIRLLKAELAKGNLSAKEFEIVSSKVGELEDGLARTKARSGDLITTLQLIPGPIGEIASKLNGSIALLKTFSGFSLKDIKFQLKETLDDVRDIASAFGKATGITKIYTALNNALAASFVKVGVGEAAAATGARALSAALVATGIGALVVGLGLAVSALMEFASGTKEAEREQKKLGDTIARTNELLDLDLASAGRRQKVRIAELRQSGADEKTIREQGIKDLKENLALTNEALVKAAATENEVMKNTKLSREDLEKAQAERVKLEKQVADLSNQIKVQEIDNATATNKELKDQRAKNLADAQKNAQEEKQFQQQKLNDQKSALDAQIELEISKGNTSAAELEKLYKKRNQFDLDELNAAAKNAKALLDKGKISKEEYNNVIGGIDAKRVLIAQKTTELIKKAGEDDAKVIEDNKKRDEDAIKSTEDFNRKIRDLKTSAILDDTTREKQARNEKLSDDLAALETDAEFIKKSEEEKGEIRKTIRQIYNNDIAKIDETARNKEIENDEQQNLKKLRILELQGQGLIEGTKAYFENRREILKVTEDQELTDLKNQLDKNLLTQEEYEKSVTAVTDKYSKLRKGLKQDEKLATIKAITQTIDAFASLTSAIASSYDEEAKVSKTAFEKRKKILIAGAIMQTASGVIGILTAPMPGVDPITMAIIKGLSVAALLVTTGINIAKIRATQFGGDGGGTAPAEPAPYSVRANRAAGGIVTGEGTSTSDSINARLSNGEYVVNARATSAFLPLLNSMNDAGLQPRFAAGGLNSTTSNNSFGADTLTRAIQDSMMERPIKTYVVGTDMSNQQQYDRTIKSRSVV